MKKNGIFRKGQKYECILSKSPGYKVGEVYECYLNEKGKLAIRGRDGYEDLTDMLQSTFKEVRKEKKNESTIT